MAFFIVVATFAILLVCGAGYWRLVDEAADLYREHQKRLAKREIRPV